MDQDQLVKVSVFLPEPIHHFLKRKSVDERSSLQKVIADLAVAATKVEDPQLELPDSLSLLIAPTGALQTEKPDARIVRKWQTKLKRVLESGNQLAILNCTASIEAMEALIGSGTPPDQNKGGAPPS